MKINTSTRYRATVHLFYETDRGAVNKHIKSIILFNVDYGDIPTVIDKIVMEYYSTYSWHEIKSVGATKDEIWVNNELI